MDSLPNELVIEIFNYIQKITDKRQFLKTCTNYNILTKQSFIDYEKNYDISDFEKMSNYCVEKFTLELCHDKYFDMIPELYINKNNRIIMKAAATFNCIKLLDLTLEKGCRAYSEYNSYYYCNGNLICLCAGTYGHLDILEWIIKKKDFIDSIINNTNICARAASYGQLNIIKWLRGNGFKWDEWTCIYAAANNHLEVLQWALANGCKWSEMAYDHAKAHDQKKVLKWIKENGYAH